MAKPIRYSEEMIKELVERGCWDDTTLADLWDRNAQLYPDNEAVVDSRLRLTWAQARQLINRLASGLLQLGFKKDDVLVLQIPNCVEQVLLRVACEKAGILCLPALRSLRHAEMKYILGHSGAKGIVIPWRFRNFDHFRMIQEIRSELPCLQHVLVIGEKTPQSCISVEEMMKQPLDAKCPPDYPQATKLKATEVSLILHTTGSTGLPKLVEYCACHRIWQWRNNAKALQVSGSDVFGLISPHPGGIAFPAYFGAPLVGAKLAMLEIFDAEQAFRLIERERVTIACVVPTQLATMADHPKADQYDLSSIRIWWCTGASLSYEVGVRAEARLGGVIVTVYGATDWGCECINLPGVSQRVRLSTVGKPIDGTEIKVVDEAGRELPVGEIGEVWGRGPSAVSGYFNDPEATAEVWTEEGWYKTGDLGKLDEEGNLVIVGRKKDMIIRGGQNIYPVEIESLLRQHPKVRDVAIVGMPDPVMGERACAFVVPKSGQQFTFDEMVSFLRESRIASFKIPERLELVSKLPTIGGVKVDKKALVTIITEKLKAEGRI